MTAHTLPPPENRIAGKRFYIAATYSDKQAREDLISTIMRHGGASVGHWLSADYYVSVNYSKPTLLGCTVLNVRTLLDEWIPEAQHLLNAQAEVKAILERDALAKQLSLTEKAQHALDTRLNRIEEALTQITNQLNMLSTVTVASTRPAHITPAEGLATTMVVGYAKLTPEQAQRANELINATVIL